MSHDLRGRRALVIATGYGVEQDELVVPVEYLRSAGAHVDIAAPTTDDIVTLVGDKSPGRQVTPTLAFDDVDAKGYGLLVIPGGTINADALRLNTQAMDIVRAFLDVNATVAAICHGPWALVEVDAVRGKTLTSYPSLQTDIRNAGGTWVDQPVSVDDSEAWTLITSRTPDDLDDFTREIGRDLAEFDVPEQPVY